MDTHKDGKNQMDGKTTRKRWQLEALPYYRPGQVQLRFDVVMQLRAKESQF